jgi:Domain of unknown function (DUF4124)
MKHLVIIGFLFSSLIASQPTLSSSKVYTWTDAEGLVHYGERPPKDTKATTIRTRTGHSEHTPQPTVSPAANPSTGNTENAAQPQQANDSLKNPERCESARQNLTTLTNSSRVRVSGENGELRYLTDEEKQQKMTETQTIIDQACE